MWVMWECELYLQRAVVWYIALHEWDSLKILVFILGYGMLYYTSTVGLWTLLGSTSSIYALDEWMFSVEFNKIYIIWLDYQQFKRNSLGWSYPPKQTSDLILNWMGCPRWQQKHNSIVANLVGWWASTNQSGTEPFVFNLVAYDCHLSACRYRIAWPPHSLNTIFKRLRERMDVNENSLPRLYHVMCEPRE
jgi:hypothetical protein